ncbi:50S ribosomal protein L5 [candidate division WS5 bacterium]|uniref:Large ribosomal subunit protein uL5 n=1 Tax=candidate division WS5 bacterium TaxID=2093353 RepID=A0A419DAD0_9BACT|nr:MAG: 50S ribosomal protein L5 [candidate division WS5 bacterium]
MALTLDLYKKEIIGKLKDDLGYKNIMEVPKLEVIQVNAGVGRGSKDSKELDNVIEGLKIITGLSPVKTKAKKSIAGFKIREEMEIGAKVTLRGEKMYDFLDRLIHVALPRVRDFRGIKPGAFDGHGNYSLGIKDHSIFPEVPYDKFPHSFAFQINIRTSAKTDEEAKKLLEFMGFPFKK